MTPPKWRLVNDEHPWDLSALISASTGLLLSVLLLLGVAISFFTSRFVKFFGLEAPCTYIGCSHPLRFPNEGHQKRFSLGIRSGEDSPRSCGNTSTSLAHYHLGQDQLCACADNSLCEQRKQSKRLWHQDIHIALSNRMAREDYATSLWTGSNISGFAAKDLYEKLKIPSDYKEEVDCEATHIKCQDCEYSSSSSPLKKRRGRSKRPRRRDFVYNRELIKAYPALPSTGSNSERNDKFNAKEHGMICREELKNDIIPTCDFDWGQLVLLSSGSNSENKDGLNAEEQGMICSEEPKHDMVPIYHLDPVHTVLKHAIKGDSLADLSNAEINVALTSVNNSTETNGGYNTGSQCNVIQLSSKSEQERECQGHIIPEGLSNHVMIFAVEDANKSYSSKGVKAQGEEAWLDYSNNTGTPAIVGNSERCNQGLLGCENNEYAIQFGSIVVRTRIKDGITNLADGDADTFHSANIVTTGSGGSQEQGCIVSLTDRHLLQFGSIVAFDAAASGKNLSNALESNDATTCTMDGSSAESFEGMFRLTQNGSYLRSHLENDEDEGMTIPEDKREQNLDELKLSLQAERLLLAALEVELENERNAAAIATNEAMAMIARLQEEKSVMQMKVTQLQRMAEERADYDEQAMAILKEILFRREAENVALEKEIELYREKLPGRNAAEPHGRGLNEPGNPSLQPNHKPLLITGQDAEYSSLHGQHGRDRGSPWMPPSGPIRALEELTTISAEQNSNKRLRGFQDSLHGLSFEQINDRKHGLDGPRDIYEQATSLGAFSQISDGETLIEKGAFVSAERFQEDSLGDGAKSRKTLAEIKCKDRHMTSDLERNGEIRRFTESCGAQFKYGMRIEGEGQENGCCVFVPIHDVYEVHPGADRSPPSVEIRELPTVLDGTLTDQGILSYTAERQRMTKTITLSDETLRSTASVVQGTGWDMEISFYAEDLHERHALPTLSMASKEVKQTEMEDIKHLEARLKTLEEDRESIKSTVDSFKHRDSELSMLQEISKHLQELRVITFAGASSGSLSKEMSASSPSRARPLKKRRFCSGLGHARPSLHYQRSV